tara:strand:+ start:167 stop:454 length:288 start_codon:yes stop_codon:yes gene_type:complete
MKITKSQLKKIIKEELANLNELGQPAPEEGAEGAAPEQKLEGDVQAVLDRIPRINKTSEFQQLLSAVVDHAPNVPNGTRVLYKYLQTFKAKAAGK